MLSPSSPEPSSPSCHGRKRGNNEDTNQHPGLWQPTGMSAVPGSVPGESVWNISSWAKGARRGGSGLGHHSYVRFSMYGLPGMFGLLSSAGHLAAMTIGSPGDAIAAIVWTNKGFVLGQLGEPDQAIECFDKALEINPRDAEGFLVAFLKGKHQFYVIIFQCCLL